MFGTERSNLNGFMRWCHKSRPLVTNNITMNLERKREKEGTEKE